MLALNMLHSFKKKVQIYIIGIKYVAGLNYIFV